MKNLSDRELALLAQAGDNKALEMLFGKMKKSVQISLRRTFNKVDTATIEDISQNALMKAFQYLGKYNPTFSFNAWVTTIAKNSMIDHMRRKNCKLDEVSLDKDFTSNEDDEGSNSLIGKIESSSLNPQEIMENKDKSVFAMTIIESDIISDKIRELAKMRLLDQLSYDEISERTNTPLGTVKARLYRFRELVKDSVSEKRKESVYEF